MSQTVEESTTSEVTNIYSAYGRHKAFLEIVQQGDRVRVQSTKLGHTSLNRFWQVWLRELILTKTDTEHGFSVELYGGRVIVGSQTTQAGLRETVHQLATEIRPLMHSPLERWNNRNNSVSASYGPITWVLRRPDVPVTEIIKSIPLLPHGTYLKFDEHTPARSKHNFGSIVLTFGDAPISGSEIAMMVELHFALSVVK